MQLTKDEVVSLYDNEHYLDILRTIEPTYKPGIDYETMYDVLIQHSIQAMQASGIETEAIIDACKSYKKEIISYCLIRYEDSLPDDSDDQEYPQGEEPGEDEEDITLALLPFYKNFLLSYVIEFLLIKTDGDIMTYMNTMRQPQAKKYIAKIKRLYKKI